MIGAHDELEKRVEKLETTNKQLELAVKMLMYALGIRPTVTGFERVDQVAGDQPVQTTTVPS